MIGGCGHVPLETDTQRNLRAYLTALKIVESLKAQGKLKDICRDSAMQIPLFKNIVCRIYNNKEVQVYFGKETKKPQKGAIEVKI